MRRLIPLLPLLIAVWLPAQTRPTRPEPTFRNVPYGPHERNVLDLYQASGDGPRPLAVYIHGGGFRGGSKESVNPRALQELLAAGVSVAAIHYRLVQQAKLPAAHEDSRRALQFLRSKASEWNLDKTRVGAFGGSAGAQICMWLAYHDEMAKPDSEDPIERESTRLAAVAPASGQTTMDFAWWFEHIPGYTEPHRPPEEYFGSSDPNKIGPIIRDIAALELVSPDDPPTFMTYGMAPDAAIPDGERATGWKVHHVNFGLALANKLDAAGVENVIQYPGKRSEYGSAAGFLIAKLAGKH